MEEIIIKTQGGKHIKYINDIFGIEIIPINAQHAPTSPYWPSTINHGQEAIINFITNTAEYEINFADITVINADYDLIIEEWDGSPGGDYGNYWGYLTLSNPTGPVKVIIDNTWFGYYDNGISGLVTNRFRVNNNILEIKTLSNGTGIIPGEAFSASNDHGYGLPS